MPEFLQAVAQVYLNWYDVSDQEVIEILRNWEINSFSKK
jgi:predicted phosphoribosyltransferase